MPHPVPARRHLATAIALVAVLAAGACSARGGSTAIGPASSTTSPRASTTTTTTPRVDPADFDPCALVRPTDLATLVDGIEPVLARGLALGAKTPIDECRLDSVGPGVVSVGVAANDPGSLQDLLPPPSTPAAAKAARQLADLGDEAFVQEVDGSYYVVADAGRGRQLRVRADTYGLAEDDPEPVIALARRAAARLPERLPDGGTALPTVCDGLDPDLVAAVVGDVVLARGSAVGDGFTCDLLGDDGTKAFVEAYRTSDPVVDDVLANGQRWRPIAGGDQAAVSASGQYFVATATDGVEVAVDTGAPDAPVDGEAKGGYPVDGDRRALFLAGVELARSLG